MPVSVKYFCSIDKTQSLSVQNKILDSQPPHCYKYREAFGELIPDKHFPAPDDAGDVRCSFKALQSMNTSTCTTQSDAEVKVSVVVPVYNSAAYLQRCLDSLSAQMKEGIEFVCVNDGSTDTSASILDTQAARDPRFRIIHKENEGYGKALNTAMKTARGVYIGIVEPDDWVEADMFSHLLGLAEKTGADIIKANYTIERKKISRPNEKFANYEEGACLAPANLPEYLSGAPSIWSAIYRREWLDERQIVFTETPGASFQDLGFCIRTWLSAGKIAITHKAPYHYWEDNPVSSSRRMEDGAWAAYRELSMLSKVYEGIPADAKAIRSYLVRRIFATLRADYRHRIRETVKSFLLKYSNLLKKNFPLETLQQDIFTKNEWYDLQLIYTTPLLFPRKSRTRANLLQRVFSIRREANSRILRILGMSFILPRRK